MTVNAMFEKASRLKLRFQTARGELTVEDLWDLRLTSINSINLDNIAIELNKKLKETEQVSFVSSTKKTNEVDQLKFDIVKHIIDTRVEEARQQREIEATRAAKAATKERIVEILEQKKTEELSTKSVEELTQMLKEI